MLTNVSVYHDRERASVLQTSATHISGCAGLALLLGRLLSSFGVSVCLCLSSLCCLPRVVLGQDLSIHLHSRTSPVECTAVTDSDNSSGTHNGQRRCTLLATCGNHAERNTKRWMCSCSTYPCSWRFHHFLERLCAELKGVQHIRKGHRLHDLALDTYVVSALRGRFPEKPVTLQVRRSGSKVM